MDAQEAVRQTRTGEVRESSAPPPPAGGDGGSAGTRRAFMNATARKLAYAAPLVLLFHPQRACASGGSQITP